jgi:hypothetical protein
MSPPTTPKTRLRGVCSQTKLLEADPIAVEPLHRWPNTTIRSQTVAHCLPIDGESPELG